MAPLGPVMPAAGTAAEMYMSAPSVERSLERNDR